MKRKLTAISLFAAAAVSMWAAVVYNENITAIFGTGNPNGGWTADTSNGIQLALRAKNRTTGDTTNVTGVYTFASAASPSQPNRASWNYEFSINSDRVSGALPLSTYDYYLQVDGNPSQCIAYNTVDPLTYWVDNSYGNNTTANGQGVEGPASAHADTNNVAQNSQNITFGDYPGGAQTLTPNATYNYELYAVEKGDGPSGDRLASVSITVVVGSGGDTCNVPTDKAQCKNGGWMTRTRGDGTVFANQGDCIQYLNTGN